MQVAQKGPDARQARKAAAGRCTQMYAERAAARRRRRWAFFSGLLVTCTTTTSVPGPESRVTLVMGPSGILGDTQVNGRFTFFPDGGSPCSTTVNNAPALWNNAISPTNQSSRPPSSAFGVGSRVAVAERTDNPIETRRQGLSGPVHMWDGGVYAFVNLTNVDGGGAGAMASLGFPRHSAKAIYASHTGGILVVGGLKTGASEFGVNVASDFEANVEYLDPTTGKWIVVYDGGDGRRVHHTLTELSDGRIVAIGGVVGAAAVSTGLVFNPESRAVGVLSPSVAPTVFGHTASLAATANSPTSNEVIVYGGATTLTGDAGADALPIDGLQSKVTRLNFNVDPPTKTETTLASQLAAAFHAAATPRRLRPYSVYFFGGATGSPARASNAILAWDMETNTLGAVSGALSVKRMLHVAVHNPADEVAEMWVVGGVGVDGGLASVVETVVAASSCCAVSGVDGGTPRAGALVGEMPFGAPLLNALGRLQSVPTRYVVVGGRGATGAVVAKAEVVSDGGVSAWGDVSGALLGAAVASTPWGVVMIGGVSGGAAQSTVLSIGEQVAYEAAVTTACP